MMMKCGVAGKCGGRVAPDDDEVWGCREVWGESST